ncbi:hypothetical protein BGZ73_006462 [Actinomortierella ambigua]|nr:hypothetical protein BGZ73_006462 [Actinomortierella ambigua]
MMNNQNQNNNSQNNNQNVGDQHPSGSFADTLKAYAGKAKAMGHQYFEHAKEQISHLQQHETKNQPEHASTLATNKTDAAATNTTQQSAYGSLSDVEHLFDQPTDQAAAQTASSAAKQTDAATNAGTRAGKKAASHQNQL